MIIRTNLSKKAISGPKQKQKNEHSHRIPHCRNSLVTKFHFKQRTITFWLKFAQKWSFWSKAEKVNITI